MRHTSDGDLRYFMDQVLPRHDVWVYVEGDAPLGFIAFRPGHVEHLYVDPPMHRRGIGAALLQKAKESSPDGLKLFTHTANRVARTFYERHGFEPIRFGTSPRPENEPDVEYQWKPETLQRG